LKNVLTLTTQEHIAAIEDKATRQYKEKLQRLEEIL
jgi:hypothetical protein